VESLCQEGGRGVRKLLLHPAQVGSADWPNRLYAHRRSAPTYDGRTLPASPTPYGGGCVRQEFACWAGSSRSYDADPVTLSRSAPRLPTRLGALLCPEGLMQIR
jgi:hypothetical protein